MQLITRSVFSLLLLSAAIVRADDWPQWLGPNRDSIWRESGIVEKFLTNGPPVLWRTAIGAGYSGPSVAGGRVYVTDRQLDEGRIILQILSHVASSKAVNASCA